MDSNYPILSECFSAIFISTKNSDGQRSSPSKKKNPSKKTLTDLIGEVNNGDSRRFHLEYMDKASKDWVKITDETILEDLHMDNGIPSFCIVYTEKEPAFASKHIYNERGLKKLTGVELRIPQQNALNKVKEKLGSVHMPSKFMVIMPTGTGKSWVISLLPFVLNASKVLFVSPNPTLRDQLVEDVRNNLKTAFKDLALVVSSYGHKCSPDNAVVVAHIQALVDKSKGKDEDKNVDDEGKPISVHPKATDFFKKFKPSLVVFDEGHHAPAGSWEAIHKALLEANPSCKTVMLTATPQRGDGKYFGLEHDHYFLYSRQDAITERLIKRTEYHPVPIVDSNSFWKQVLQPAVGKLQELRATLGGKPIRMLVSTQTTREAEDVATFLNSEFPTFYSAAVTGKTANCNETTTDLFKYEVAPQGGKLVDIVVQCKMLGEGYDNPWIAITVLLVKTMSVGVLSQLHGRALRLLNLPGENSPQKNIAHLFYSAFPKLETSIEEYKDGVDEDKSRLFSEPPFSSFSDAHTKIAQSLMTDGVEFLKENFDLYHEKYAEQRANWKVIPAEKIADQLFANHGSHALLRVVDFGCGQDALLEWRLAKIWKGTKVSVVAVDVQSPASVPESTAHFECKSIVSSYGDFNVPPNSFDVAVFCLSIMSQDGLGKALEVSKGVLSSFGRIIIVVPKTKFVYPVYNDAKDKIKQFAAKLQKLGIIVAKSEVSDMFVYFEIECPSEEVEIKGEILALRFNENTAKAKVPAPSKKKSKVVVEEEEEVPAMRGLGEFQEARELDLAKKQG